MIIVNWKDLDPITKMRYAQFYNQLLELEKKYSREDGERFTSFKARLEEEKGKGFDCDFALEMEKNNQCYTFDFAKILLYEYCVATERITNGRISFEECANRLFKEISKIKLGNPTPGIDDECLYGKTIDDETAIPVTSKSYRLTTSAGAQHLEYFKEGQIKRAIFLFEKGRIDDFGIDSDGKPVPIFTDGIDFHNLNSPHSLLTILRQTLFHEIDHSFSKEIVEENENSQTKQVFVGPDGKRYINYQKYNSYVEYPSDAGAIKNPTFVRIIESDGKKERIRWYYVSDDGTLISEAKLSFGLQKHKLEKELCVSTGINTMVIDENGEIHVLNGADEGMVETTARAQVMAIAPDTKDMELGHYSEPVKVLKRVVETRDSSLGNGGEGQTFADFLSHSSIFMQDLESSIITIEDGTQVDSLHYIAQIIDIRNIVLHRLSSDEHVHLTKNEEQKLREQGNWGEEHYDENMKKEMLEKVAGIIGEDRAKFFLERFFAAVDLEDSEIDSLIEQLKQRPNKDAKTGTTQVEFSDEEPDF